MNSILRLFLHFATFPWIMSLAAGAVATGGASTGSTGGTSGGTAIPGTGGTETGTGGSQGGKSDLGGASGSDTATDDAGDFGGDFEATDFGQDEDVQPTAGSGEEYGPEQYKTIKEALKAQPEVFKSVKKAIGMVKRFQEHFESPEAAGELLTDIQSLGGWDTIKQDMAETSTFLTGFNAGDTPVVEKWLDENGDGLAKNMPTIIKKWQEKDMAGWAHDAAQTFIATLDHHPVGGISALTALSQLGQMEGVKDSDAYKRIVEVVTSVQKQADTAPVRTAKGPDESKLTAREQQVQQREQQLMRQQFAGAGAPILNKEADNALKIAAGGRKLSEPAKAHLLKQIHARFAEIMELDKESKGKRQNLIAAGQKEQWLKMVRSAAVRTYPKAARDVLRLWNGISGLSEKQKQERKAEGQQRTESGTGGTGTGELEKLSPMDGSKSLVDQDAMWQMFGGRAKAEDAFMFGSPKHGGKRVWIRRGDRKMFWY